MEHHPKCPWMTRSSHINFLPSLWKNCRQASWIYFCLFGVVRQVIRDSLLRIYLAGHYLTVTTQDCVIGAHCWQFSHQHWVFSSASFDNPCSLSSVGNCIRAGQVTWNSSSKIESCFRCWWSYRIRSCHRNHLSWTKCFHMSHACSPIRGWLYCCWPWLPDHYSFVVST